MSLLVPLSCCTLPTLNPPSVLLSKEEVTMEKANSLFVKDSTTTIPIVLSKDVAGITSWLSFVLLVAREFSMTKAANRSVANHRSFHLLFKLEVQVMVVEVLVMVMVMEESEEKERDIEEPLMLYSMSLSNIMMLLTLRSFRTLWPCW